MPEELRVGELLELSNLSPGMNVRSPDKRAWGTVSGVEADSFTISWCTIDGKNLSEDRILKYGFDSQLELVAVPWRDPMPRDYRLPAAVVLAETKPHASNPVVAWFRRVLKRGG